MQGTHDHVFVVKGAGLNDGAAQHLDQTGADGIDHDTNQNSGIGIGQKVRQKGQAQKAQAGRQAGGNDAGPVADAVYDLGTDKVDDQLREKV